MNLANWERHPDELLRDAEGGAELTPGQAERLANFLLGRYGANPEYPCTAKDSLPSDQQPTSPEELEDDSVARAPYTHAVGERGWEAGGARRETGDGVRRRREAGGLMALLHKLPRADEPARADSLHGTDAASQGRGEGVGGGRASAAYGGEEGTFLTSAQDSSSAQGPGPGQEPPAHLLPLVARLLADADLTPRQRQVARRILLRGLTAREVAWELSVTAGTVRKMWARAQASLGTALEKIAQPTCPPTCPPKSWRRISRTDIAAVYVEEVNRHGYYQPRHCPPGQEMCKRTGVCPFVVRLSELRPTSY